MTYQLDFDKTRSIEALQNQICSLKKQLEANKDKDLFKDVTTFKEKQASDKKEVHHNIRKSSVPYCVVPDDPQLVMKAECQKRMDEWDKLFLDDSSEDSDEEEEVDSDGNEGSEATSKDHEAMSNKKKVLWNKLSAAPKLLPGVFGIDANRGRGLTREELEVYEWCQINFY